MQRTSKALASLIQYATQGGQPMYWLPALHILMTVEPGFLRADGPPHALLSYVTGKGIDFRTMLEEYHFTGAQRQAILAAWELFNNGAGRDGPKAEFKGVCFRLDEGNFRAVMDGMRVRTERDPGHRIRRRLLAELLGVLEEWKEAGL